MTVRAEAGPPVAGPLVFLDRDGTLIVERHYLGDPAGVTLEDGVAEGLHHLRGARARIAVVTNQSGIARGYFTPAAVAAVHAEVDRQLAREGLHLDGWYLCPHGPQDGCRCRKPAPGLVEAACRDLACDPAGCFVIGDKSSDVDLATRVGGTGILVSRAPEAARSGSLAVPSFRDAARTVTRLWRERQRASDDVGRVCA
ncbi:HAD family hydrolase [Methylobacterium currus]|uniref:D,D-heptose 1,7-bisphosphate phosphatase n=1 Tax=Methylobacterium currus TaxID=2051553 RepID=A0A2R4WUL5_9HYPH|nr:HAD family hydrolase [Methylobacterium currus]AWB25237.1 HAD family hydrolase [Methylobacterium currus]UHC19533.1 HAD family hydrolase [Methylobacterium currus]